jgi:tetratricopeptide (TPR) repeat protein
MTATAAPDPDPDDCGSSETESHDSVLVEFTDASIDFTPRPVRDTVLRHLPTWLRRAAETSRQESAIRRSPVTLAECLLEQARLFVQLKRYAEALPKLTEAERLFQDAGSTAGVADCYRVAAGAHEGLGEPDKALDYLRREEDLRRRLAA